MLDDDHVVGVGGKSFSSQEKSKRSYRLKSLDDYQLKWQQARDLPDIFWAGAAQKHLLWGRSFDKVFERRGSHFEWFLGGSLNLSANCLDRHLESSPHKLALCWEDELGHQRSYTYKELHQEVCRLSQALVEQGLRAKDCVTLYLSVSPELVISMLSCARLGLIHNVVFAGFSPDSLASRIEASQSKLLISQDAFYRKGKPLHLKNIVDKALATSSYQGPVWIFDRQLVEHEMKSGRDLYVHDLLSSLEKVSFDLPENFPSEHPLFLLYTSGSTGEPKGLLHTTAGYLLGVKMTLESLFNLNSEDRMWCTADLGWITGHSYAVYGPLSFGATTFLYEGAPLNPDPGRWWRMIEAYKITKFYTAPTAIRMAMMEGDEWLEPYDLSSLELLACAGEPIGEKPWEWFFETVGQGRCEILDTWWQTETGSVAVAPLPGVAPLKPGCASRPFFGVIPKVLDSHGSEVACGRGALYFERPTPSMARTVFGDHERYEREYWCEKTGYYRTSDACYLDPDGELWILGRMDDVINVSGHRLSTMEIESVLGSHPYIAESSCVGYEDPLTGEALASFLILSESACGFGEKEIESELSSFVSKKIGPFARPKQIHILEALPKTRSGKVMRRVLRSFAARKKPEGDFSTLEDPSYFEMSSLRKFLC